MRSTFAAAVEDRERSAGVRPRAAIDRGHHQIPVSGAGVQVNTADNWLHFVLGLGVIAAGILFGRRTVASTAPDASPGIVR
ncbi:hypothetical protein ROP_31940 [Rhodococcus opacus B4]|uniref:Uncharacterized protein n=1 Tax=Rhodococcus opacus (strain B4) TaxID=632772 RepID=C1B6Y8_RHOOB|nr:hypothetical protein ROP_31940 [Rhodococcus opacus B4]